MVESMGDPEHESTDLPAEASVDDAVVAAESPDELAPTVAEQAEATFPQDHPATPDFDPEETTLASNPPIDPGMFDADGEEDEADEGEAGGAYYNTALADLDMDFGGLDEAFDTIGFDGGFLDSDDAKAEDDKTPTDGIDGVNLNAPQWGVDMVDWAVPPPFQEPNLKALQRGLVGIDLGSSDAVVASFDADGRATIIANSVDDRTTPSRILRDTDGDWLIGKEARSLAPTLPEFDFGDLKSLFLLDNWATVIDEQEYTAKTLLATFVKCLLEDVAEQLPSEPTHLALAAPVWFSEKQRGAMANAVETLGLKVVGVTDESLAASVPYSLRLPDLQARKVVVVDVGFKGSSIAFIECAAGDLRILCQAGLPDLGGINWDELLTAEVVRKFSEYHGFDPREDPVCMTDMALRVEEAKKALSQRRQAVMRIQSKGETLKVQFSREAFERASQKILKRLRSFIKLARDKGGFDSWDEFDALIIAGGGARMPMVKAVVEETVGRQSESFNTEEAIAIGALYWGMSTRYKLSDDD